MAMQLEAKRLEKTNAFVTNMLISRFADMLGGLDGIESSAQPDKELQKDKLLMRDVERAVALIMCYTIYTSYWNAERWYHNWIACI